MSISILRTLRIKIFSNTFSFPSQNMISFLRLNFIIFVWFLVAWKPRLHDMAIFSVKKYFVEKQKVSFLCSLPPPMKSFFHFSFSISPSIYYFVFVFDIFSHACSNCAHKSSSRHLLENELKYQIFDTRFVVFDGENIFVFRQ